MTSTLALPRLQPGSELSPCEARLIRRASLIPVRGAVGKEVIDYSKQADVITPVYQHKMWYKEAVFYEVYVRAFCDGNGDGHGDIQGLTSRLDYIQTLGVDCLWLLPIYPSPLKDDGYDVADYLDVHPTYGTLEDFKILVSAVHERNMRLIMDLIPNHTSDQHWWFQEARKDRLSPYRDYYVWSDDPTKYKDARIIFLDTETSNWTWDEVAGQYYWHRFYSSQPDLNFENPKVCEEFLNIMRFWLNIGVDGFRVDAVPYLYEEEGTNCENLPKTHVFLKRMRSLIDIEYPGCVLLAEACQMPDEVRKYFGDGDEFHMGFHFPVMPRIYMSMKAGDCTSLRDIMAETPEIPHTCQWVTFLRNHDELTLEMVTPSERKWMWEQYAPLPRMRLNLGIRRRLAPLLSNDRRLVELAHSLLLTLPGTPILYYGDEIGMGDNIWLPDRNGVRTPMQWEPTGPTAGFSEAADFAVAEIDELGTAAIAGRLYAPMVADPEFRPEKVNVQDAMQRPESLFSVIRHMIAVRRRHSACFGWGKFHWVPTNTMKVASFLRSSAIDHILVLSNVSEHWQEVEIEIPRLLTAESAFGTGFSAEADDAAASACDELDEGCEREDVLTGSRFRIANRTMHLVMSPYQFLWINLTAEKSHL